MVLKDADVSSHLLHSFLVSGKLALRFSLSRLWKVKPCKPVEAAGIQKALGLGSWEASVILPL